MPLKVVTQPDILDPTTFTYVVPATEIWSLRSVVALAARGTGGAPDRAYRLVITDGTNVVSAFGAADAGDEPGLCRITWCNAPAGADHSGAEGIVSAPMVAKACPTGYTIVATITGAVAGDSWVSGLVWCDYTLAPGT